LAWLRTNVEDRRRVDRLVVFVADRGVDEDGSVVLDAPGTTMDVSEAMHSGTNRMDSDLQFFAPEVFSARSDLIQDSVWRAMRHQDIGIHWDPVPLLPDPFSVPGEVERPVVEPGLPRRPPEPEPADLAPGIFQVGDLRVFRQQHLADVMVSFETEIVIPGDENLVLVGECVKPAQERCDLSEFTCPGGISAVNDDISIRDGEALVQVVGVTDHHEAHKNPTPRGSIH